MKMSSRKSIRRTVPENGWRFLTGDVNNIASITESVGYRFKKEVTWDRTTSSAPNIVGSNAPI